MAAFNDEHGSELSLREMPEELAPVVTGAVTRSVKLQFDTARTARP